MTATETTNSTPAWRAAVIGIVAVLAVGIGIAVGAFLMGARDAAIGSGASYVPATAPIYFEVRLEPSEAQDAALREFLGHFPEIEGVDLGQPLYGQLTAMLDEMVAAEEATDLSWSADVEPWFDGRVGVALLEFPDAALDPAMPETEVFGSTSAVVLVAITDPVAAQASLERIFAESEAPVTFTDQEHAGVTIHVDEQSSAAYALTDDQLLFATSADDIVAALDAHANSSTTLSEADSITALTDALPDEWLVFGIYDFTDALASAFEGPAAASPGADIMRDLMANQSLRGAMALTVDGDRVSLPMVSDVPTGPFTVTNADRGLADEVPGDALYYAEGGNVGESLSSFVRTFKEMMGTMPDAAGQLDMAESALGGNLEELVDWIGDVATVGGFDGEQPWGGAIIVPTDMEAARRTMDRLESFAGLATLDPSIGITVDQRDVEGVEITSLTLAGSERRNRARSGDGVRADRGRRRVGRHRRSRPARRRRPVRRARPRPGRRRVARRDRRLQRRGRRPGWIEQRRRDLDRPARPAARARAHLRRDGPIGDGDVRDGDRPVARAPRPIRVGRARRR